MSTAVSFIAAVLVLFPGLTLGEESTPTAGECTPIQIDLGPSLPGPLTPISSPMVSHVSDNKKVAEQLYAYYDAQGNLAVATLTCTSTCTGNGCQIHGCDPSGGNCTACSCKKAPGEPSSPPCSHCTCTKKVTAQEVLM